MTSLCYSDDLPFGPEERRITRIANNRCSSPHTPSKTLPTNSNSDSTNGGNMNGLTAKLCHLNSEQSSGVTGALSHSATVDSSAQGMELGQGEMFDSSLQPWASEGGIAVLNAN